MYKQPNLGMNKYYSEADQPQHTHHTHFIKTRPDTYQSEMTTLYAAFFVLSATLLLTIFAGKCRRLLSCPPGPLALPIIGHLHLLRPSLHQTFHNLSQRYGPLIHLRLGSIPCVVASTPDLAREFLKTHELVFSSRHRTTAIDIVTYDSSFAFSPYSPYWKYVKKLCTHELIGARSLTHFQPIRTAEVKSFLEILMHKGKTGESFNVTEELMKLTRNVISVMMVSARWSEMAGEAADEARTVFREVAEIFGEFVVSDILWFCRNLDLQGIRKRSEDIRRRCDALLEKIISEREEMRRSTHRGNGGEEATDCLDVFLDIMESGKSEVEFTREHLKALILVRSYIFDIYHGSFCN